ncbi:MAG: MlaC/ttg2D family ABC transporter substrate-binding protein [Thermodesulforhabdaceae bacterium]|jgi:phospholipid transport system substrate-binding protein
MFRKIFILGVAVLTILVISVSEAAQTGSNDSPTLVIKSMIKEVFDILNRSCSQGHSIRAHRNELFDVASRYVDLDEVAPRVVGPSWREQSREAQEEFKKLFREMVFMNYSDRLERFACEEERVSYEGEEVQGNIARVRTRIESPRQGEAVIEYRLKKKPTGWKIYDVVVEGISMVQNYRSQFSEILQKQSFAQMLDILRNKVGTP